MHKVVLSSLTALALISSVALASRHTSATSTAATSTTALSTAGTSVSAPAFTVNVNTAGRADLLKVPGLGAKLVDAIIAARPFKDQADLVKKVKGIGKKNIRHFGPYFTY